MMLRQLQRRVGHVDSLLHLELAHGARVWVVLLLSSQAEAGERVRTGDEPSSVKRQRKRATSDDVTRTATPRAARARPRYVPQLLDGDGKATIVRLLAVDGYNVTAAVACGGGPS